MGTNHKPVQIFVGHLSSSQQTPASQIMQRLKEKPVSAPAHNLVRIRLLDQGAQL